MIRYISAFAEGASNCDPYYDDCVYLLHFNGSDGDTTTVDSSPSPATMTMTSADTLSSTQKKFGTTSLKPSGSTGKVYASWASYQTRTEFGNGAFTIEGWIYPTSTPSGLRGLVCVWHGLANTISFWFGLNGQRLAFFWSTTGTDNPNIGYDYTFSTNTWYHVAVDRDSSGEIRLYLDGAVVANTNIGTTSFADNGTSDFVVGNDNYGGRNFVGYIDEVRVTKGVARYAGAFTPQTAEFADVQC